MRENVAFESWLERRCLPCRALCVIAIDYMLDEPFFLRLLFGYVDIAARMHNVCLLPGKLARIMRLNPFITRHVPIVKRWIDLTEKKEWCPINRYLHLQIIRYKRQRERSSWYDNEIQRCYAREDDASFTIQLLVWRRSK